MSFGYFQGRFDETLKSWAPQLRSLLSRLSSLEVSSSDVFSSAGEIQTSKTFDDRPVFRKVIDIGSLPNVTTKTVAHNISSLTNVLTIEGFATNGTDHIPLPYPSTSVAEIIRVFVTATDINIRTLINWSTYDGYIVLEYTK